MSHFAVAVFTDEDATVESLLEPYDENIEVEKYVGRTREEVIRNGRERLESLCDRYRSYLANPNAYLETECCGDPDDSHYKFLSQEFKRLYNGTDDQVLAWELRLYDEDMVDAEGNVYTTYNPNSKWDWYTVGGRFRNMLLNSTTGEYADEVPARAIDFIKMRLDAKFDLLPYEEAVNDGFYKTDYLKRKYPDEETYEKIKTSFLTRAAVTPDGEWHEVGEMGWFGLSSEHPEEIIRWVNAYYDSFLRDAIRNNWTVHIVDCHI